MKYEVSTPERARATSQCHEGRPEQVHFHSSDLHSSPNTTAECICTFFVRVFFFFFRPRPHFQTRPRPLLNNCHACLFSSPKYCISFKFVPERAPIRAFFIAQRNRENRRGLRGGPGATGVGGFLSTFCYV